MSLVKWLRKNNMKVMAVVIVIIMVGFVAEPVLQRFSGSNQSVNQAVAYFGDNEDIANKDFSAAQRELELLQILRTDVMLSRATLVEFKTLDMKSFFLYELLFTENKFSPEMITNLKRLIRSNSYRISDKQIDDIYTKASPGYVYWFLLKTEAERAGIVVSKDAARKLLARLTPQLFNGATYSDVISSIMSGHSVSNQSLSEDQILSVFSKLLAVIEYSRIVCSGSNVTIAQIQHDVKLAKEAMDVNFVKIDAECFVEAQPQPSSEQILQHFNKYKEFFPGSVSDENPYGFGYKLRDMAQLEYLVVDLNDVKTIVDKPSYEQAEEYYTKHTTSFVEQVPSDVNDPNSALIERTKEYAEVADDILEGLLQRNINIKATEIIQRAKELTEVGLEDKEVEKLTSEQFKELKSDYKAAADKLCEEFKINVYAAKTGLLDAVDIRQDDLLSTLYVKGYANFPVALNKVIFAVDELSVSQLGRFETTKPRMYENIGPMRNVVLQEGGKQIIAIVRIVEANKASVPADIKQVINKNAIVFEQSGDNVYSVKDAVIKNLKMVAAMETAKAKAAEFIASAEKNGWDKTTEKFNNQFGGNIDDPNAFVITSFKNVKNESKDALITLAIQNTGDPAAQIMLVERIEIQSMLTDKIYNIVPQDKETIEQLPVTVEFKPNKSFYIVKDIKINRVSWDDYKTVKSIQAYGEDVVQSQNMSVVHCNPDNIFKRMNFKWIKEND